MKWKVTGQMPTSRPGPGSTVVRGYQVTVETDTGHTDQVFVPESKYTPEGAREIISEHLSKVGAVADLTGEA